VEAPTIVDYDSTNLGFGVGEDAVDRLFLGKEEGGTGYISKGPVYAR
jgi:hypothetical protein